MNPVSSSLLVAIVEQVAFIRVTGRANFASSVHFKTLVNELRERGFNRFVLDLSECATIDSTFLGVLAGNALSGMEGRSGANDVCLQLLNHNQRVTDLLENLGIAHLFPICLGNNAAETKFAPAASPEGSPSREEISKTCLEAHQILMAANPDNIARFKDVAQFLAEDLKKLNS